MAGRTVRSTAVDRWTLVVFACVAAAALVGGLLPATMNQSQTVVMPALLLGLAGLVAAVALALGGHAAVPSTRLGLAWTLFVAWALVAAVASQRALAAFIGEPTNLLGWCALASAASVAWFAASRGDSARRVLGSSAAWLLIVQVVVVTYSLLRASGAQGIVFDLVARGTLTNSSALGQFALLLLPWSVFASSDEPGRGVAPWRIAVAAATVAVLAVARSRIALVVALLWAAWWVLGRTGLTARARTRVVAALVVLAVVGVAVFAAAQLRDPTGGQLGLRGEFARVGLAAAAASPLVGWGPDGFVAGGGSVSTPEFVSAGTPLVFMRGATDPHNLLVWVVVSTGFAGLALFAWALVEMVLAWLPELRKGDPATVAGAWAVLGALTVFLTAPVSVAAAPLFAFVLGVSLSHAHSVAAGPVRDALRPRRVAAYFLLGAVGLAGLLLAANMSARLPLERADAQRSPGLSGRAEDTARLWVVDPYLFYLASLHGGWAAQTDPQKAAARPDLVAIERATRLDRRDPFVALEHARTLRYYRSDARVVEGAFIEALRRWPTYPAARLEYAEYLLELGRIADAREQLGLAQRLGGADAGFSVRVQQLRGALEQTP